MRGVKTGGGEGIVWWRLQMEMAMAAKDSGALLLAAAAGGSSSSSFPLVVPSRPFPSMLSATLDLATESLSQAPRFSISESHYLGCSLSFL